MQTKTNCGWKIPLNLNKNKEMEKNGKKEMRGFEKQYISKVKESVKSSNAVLEFIDNAIDAGASNINIVYNDGELRVSDNGKGMSVTALKKWCDNVESHISNGKNKIGIRGVGSKAAMIALSDFNDNLCCVAELITKTNKDVAYRAIWNIVKDGKQYTDTCRFIDKTNVGTDIIIRNCIELNINDIKTLISNTYPLFADKVTINVNGEEIKFIDRCYLNVLGKDVNKDGIYLKNGISFVVDTINATNEKTLEHLSIKCVYIYLSVAEYKSAHENRNYADYGVYTLFNNRYINYGGNVLSMFRKGNSQRGGINGARLLMFCNNENAGVLGVQSDKSCGITPLNENINLRKFYIDNVEEKVSVFHAISNKFSKLRTINSYETKGYKWSKIYNEINIDKVTKIFNEKPIRDYKPRNIEFKCGDDLEHIIPNFKTQAPNKLKEVFYSIHNKLSSESYGKMSRKNIDRLLCDIWNEHYVNVVHKEVV